MIAQRTNDPVESARRVLAAFTNPSLGRAQVEPLLAEIDQLRRTRDDLFEANNRYQQEARDARPEVRSLSESKREWQPIETAPKDGTPVLLGHEVAVFSGWWTEGNTDTNAGGWIDGATNRYEEHYTYPATHWMPLPAAPARAVIAKEAGHAE